MTTEKWISVSDELPKPMEKVKIMGFEGFLNLIPFEDVDTYRHNRLKWNSQINCNTRYVTHWQRLKKQTP